MKREDHEYDHRRNGDCDMHDLEFDGYRLNSPFTFNLPAPSMFGESQTVTVGCYSEVLKFCPWCGTDMDLGSM